LGFVTERLGLMVLRVTLVQRGWKWIYLYVNGRYIKDRMVHRAITEAYSRHPSGNFSGCLFSGFSPDRGCECPSHQSEVKFEILKGSFVPSTEPLLRCWRPLPDRQRGRERAKRAMVQMRSMYLATLWPHGFFATTFRGGTSPQGQEGMTPEWERDPGNRSHPGQVYSRTMCEGESA
jgi:hypothetical protein